MASQKAFDIPTIDVSLRNKIIEGEITLEDGARELYWAGWFNYVPSKEQTIKTLKLDKVYMNQ